VQEGFESSKEPGTVYSRADLDFKNNNEVNCKVWELPDF
jgi:hypothetical protein